MSETAPTTQSTQMVNPPKSTKMVEPPKKQWIKAIRPIHIKDVTYKEGMVVEVDARTAKEFCDHKFKGPYEFEGEMSEKHARRVDIIRAVRIDAPTAKSIKEEWDRKLGMDEEDQASA